MNTLALILTRNLLIALSISLGLTSFCLAAERYRISAGISFPGDIARTSGSGGTIPTGRVYSDIIIDGTNVFVTTNNDADGTSIGSDYELVVRTSIGRAGCRSTSGDDIPRLNLKERICVQVNQAAGGLIFTLQSQSTYDWTVGARTTNATTAHYSIEIKRSSSGCSIKLLGGQRTHQATIVGYAPGENRLYRAQRLQEASCSYDIQ